MTTVDGTTKCDNEKGKRSYQWTSATTCPFSHVGVNRCAQKWNICLEEGRELGGFPPLSLKGFDDIAPHVDAACKQWTTKPTAGVDECRMIQLGDTQVVWMPASKNALEAVKRL